MTTTNQAVEAAVDRICVAYSKAHFGDVLRGPTLDTIRAELACPQGKKEPVGDADELLLRHGTTGVRQYWFTRAEVMAIVSDLATASRVPVALPAEPACFMCHGTGKHSVAAAHLPGQPAPARMIVDCRQCAPAPKQGDAKDVERYRFAAQHCVLSGGMKFGWPIAPATRHEWDRYIDATILVRKGGAA